jgi:hypothetical protein
MPVIWGNLDRIDNDQQGRRWVQLNAMVSERTIIRIRALIGRHTLIARGIERVDLFNLGTGEPVEISYHYDRGGFMEAETIYVLPQRAAIG